MEGACCLADRQPVKKSKAQKKNVLEACFIWGWVGFVIKTCRLKGVLAGWQAQRKTYHQSYANKAEKYHLVPITSAARQV